MADVSLRCGSEEDKSTLMCIASGTSSGSAEYEVFALSAADIIEITLT